MVHNMPQKSPAVEAQTRNRDHRRQGQSRRWRDDRIPWLKSWTICTLKEPNRSAERRFNRSSLIRSDWSICIWQHLIHVTLTLFIAHFPQPHSLTGKPTMSQGDHVMLRTLGGTTPSSILAKKRPSVASCPQMHYPDGGCQFPSPKNLSARPTEIGSPRGRGRKAADADRASCLTVISLLRVLGRCSTAMAPATYCI